MFRTIVAVAALALAAPAGAGADAKTLRGKTSQGRTITLTLGADGVPTSVKFRWSLACKKAKAKAPVSGSFVRPFDQATPDALSDADTVRRRYSGGLRVRTRGSISGRRAGESWSGSFSIERQFSRRGKVFDTCQAANVTWSVS